MEGQDKEKYVQSFGIAEGRAKEIAKKPALFTVFSEVVTASGVAAGCDKTIGALLFTLATTFPKAASPESRDTIARCVAKKNIDSADRLQEALLCAQEAGPTVCVAEETLRQRCKFGVVYSEQDIRAALQEVMRNFAPKSWDDLGTVREAAKKALPFGDGQKIFAELEAQMTAAFGEKKKEVKGGKKKDGEGAAQGKKVVVEGGGGKKKGKDVVVAAALPAIDLQASNSVLASQIYKLVTEGGKDEYHVVEMIADTLAAVRRDSYAKGTASAQLDPRNGIRLPNVKTQ